MKNAMYFLILITQFLLLTISTYAQITAYDGTSFSFIATDANNQLLTNQSGLTLNAILHANTASGTILYSETHTINIPSDGVVSGVLGQGTATQGNFNTLDWSAQDVVLELVLNTINQGNIQFYSVPYAQHAKTADIATTTLEKEIITINQSNYQSVTVNNNDIVRIDGTINLSGNYLNTLRKDGISILGGSFIGTGQVSTEIDLGNQHSTIQSVSFKDVTLDVSHKRVVFINCKFENVTIDGGAYFEGCTFTGTISPGIGSVIEKSDIFSANFSGAIGYFQSIGNSEVSNSSFTISIRFIHNNEIQSCSFTGEIKNATSNIFGDTQLLISRLFSDNNCTNTSISNATGQLITITKNIFEGAYPNQTEIITLDCTSGWYKQKTTISNNHFLSSSSLSRFIYISGNYTNTAGFYATTQIQENSFTNGSRAIQIGILSGNIANIVVDNITNRTTNGIGISNGGNNIVNNNYSY